MTQAVILAAGESTRTYPLTITRPKPLLKIANKPILEHNLDQLKGSINEAVIVVGYKKEMIEQYFKNKYKNIKLNYVEQKKQLGTGHALKSVEEFIDDRFILIMGDNLYFKEDIKNCLKHNYAVLSKKVKYPQDFGVFITEGNIVKGVVEKPKKFISDKANTALYVLDKKIFHYLKKIRFSIRHEYEITDALSFFSKREKVFCVNTDKWIPVVYPWDLLKADRMIRKKNIIGRNSKVNGTIINSTIGDRCVINGIVENSIIMDNTSIEKGSIIEDSVIGENVYFKGSVISEKDVMTRIKGKNMIISKLGAIIGDNVKASNVKINAGSKIWPNKELINEEVKGDYD